MRIGEFSAATGLKRETIRFYESRGLSRANLSDSGHRDYAPQIMTPVHYIRLAQYLGFTAEEVSEALPELCASPQASVDDREIGEFLLRKLIAIDERVQSPRRLRDELTAGLSQVYPVQGAPVHAGDVPAYG